MRTNLPITNNQYVVPQNALLVSMTDHRGYIVHANQAFVETSGFDYDELLGQPHNLVRHPEMPSEAFKDMWATIGRGRPWTGIVKNRRKNGDYYWVQANVTPILENGKPRGYMSIRIAASAAEIREAEQLYARLGRERATGHRTIRLHAGRVRYNGWRDLFGRVHRLTLTQRLSIALFALCFLCLGTRLLGAPFDSPFAEAAVLLAGTAGVLAWFHTRFSRAINDADAFAGDLASCNLTTSIELNHFNPLGSLIRRLWQIQMNMRAIISDVRTEVESTTAAIEGIAEGTNSLSKRTDEQASSLQQTAASMEQLTSAVKQSAESAHEAIRYSENSNGVARRGNQAMQDVGNTISEIEKSSTTVKEIISVIEEIAFQTNILALNAAVEAARAGEHGRGFAVVAAEVRSLAQRSGDAARQIRELITDSSNQVTNGARRVAAATETIQETLLAVNRIGQMVSQINLSSQEQSAGIAQINEAVAHLDSVTQHNASMAQQTASATDALQRRTATLKRSVQVFRLRESDHGMRLNARVAPGSAPVQEPMAEQRAVSRG